VYVLSTKDNNNLVPDCVFRWMDLLHNSSIAKDKKNLSTMITHSGHMMDLYQISKDTVVRLMRSMLTKEKFMIKSEPTF
jgi:hypothetical protein